MCVNLTSDNKTLLNKYLQKREEFKNLEIELKNLEEKVIKLLSSKGNHTKMDLPEDSYLEYKDNKFWYVGNKRTSLDDATGIKMIEAAKKYIENGEISANFSLLPVNKEEEIKEIANLEKDLIVKVLNKDLFKAKLEANQIPESFKSIINVKTCYGLKVFHQK